MRYHWIPASDQEQIEVVILPHQSVHFCNDIQRFSVSALLKVGNQLVAELLLLLFQHMHTVHVVQIKGAAVDFRDFTYLRDRNLLDGFCFNNPTNYP